jgi:hypothetical protein
MTGPARLSSGFGLRVEFLLCDLGGLESDFAVGAVAERLGRRSAAAAEGNSLTGLQLWDNLALVVYDYDVRNFFLGDAVRTIKSDCDCNWHKEEPTAESGKWRKAKRQKVESGEWKVESGKWTKLRRDG